LPPHRRKSWKLPPQRHRRKITTLENHIKLNNLNSKSYHNLSKLYRNRNVGKTYHNHVRLAKFIMILF
jgi:hypothetical protein